MNRPSLITYAIVLAIGFILGAAHQLDGPDELDAAESTAADVRDAQANAAASEAEHRRACIEARGPSAIFFTTAQGDHVCRLAPRSTT